MNIFNQLQNILYIILSKLKYSKLNIVLFCTLPILWHAKYFITQEIVILVGRLPKRMAEKEGAKPFQKVKK